MSRDFTFIADMANDKGLEPLFTQEGIFSGTSNLDGFGCGAELNTDNDTIALQQESLLTSSDSEQSTDGTVTMDYSEFGQVVNLTNSGNWNANGFKEGAVVSDSAKSITIDNYVDACVLVTHDAGVAINIFDAKRGLIVTGNGDDTINIEAYSNNGTRSNGSWNNTFNIDTGEGNDQITLTHSVNSHSTEYDIKAGDGCDKIDVSGLHEAVDTYYLRSADGGNGFDVLVVDDTTSITMSGFEVIDGIDDTQTLNVTADLLANNSGDFIYEDKVIFDNVLVLNDLDLVAGEGVSVTSDVTLWDFLADDALDLTLGEDTYHVLTVEASGEEYTVITDDANLMMA